MRRDSESPVWKRLDPGTVGCMAWQDSALSLIGVALGGGIAAFAGSRAARRGAAADALSALAEAHNLRWTLGPEFNLDRNLLLETRIRLLAGGASWMLVEVHERLTQACLLSAYHLFRERMSQNETPTMMYAHRITHPGRFFRRPLMQLTDAVERCLADEIERPLRSRLLRPVRLRRLRQTLGRAATDNELTRMPRFDEGDSQTAWDVATSSALAYLEWPNASALKAADWPNVPEDWWPKPQS
jgi:hypothetical protein